MLEPLVILGSDRQFGGRAHINIDRRRTSGVQESCYASDGKQGVFK